MAKSSSASDLRFTPRFEAICRGEQDPTEAWARRKTQRTLFPLDSVPTIGDTAEVEGSKVVYTWKGEPFELSEGWVRRLRAHLRPLLGRTVVYCYWRRLGAVKRTSE